MTRWLTVTLASLLVALAPGDCSARQTAADGTAKACNIGLSAPALNAGKIVVKSTATCDEMPVTHVVHLTLERADGLSWDIVGNRSCNNLPRPGHPATCVYAVPCVSGHYRVRALVTGSGHGRDFGFTPPERPEATVECGS